MPISNVKSKSSTVSVTALVLVIGAFAAAAALGYNFMGDRKNSLMIAPPKVLDKGKKISSGYNSGYNAGYNAGYTPGYYVPGYYK